MFNLDGKVAVVAGGSGYLGQAVCRALKAQGATVIVADLTEPSLQSSSNDKKSYAKNDFDFFKCNLVDELEIKRLAEYIKEKYLLLDIGINMTFGNAGKEFYKLTANDWRYSIDANLTGAFLFSRMCYSLMTELAGKSVVEVSVNSSKGNIIHFSSMYGIVSPDPRIYRREEDINPIEYGVGKAGIIQMTRYLAVKWARDGIRVNAIAPGAFPNPVVQTNREFIEALESKIPLGRIGVPEEIGGAVVFLASDEASYITGQCLIIDGGWTIW